MEWPVWCVRMARKRKGVGHCERTKYYVDEDEHSARGNGSHDHGEKEDED